MKQWRTVAAATTVALALAAATAPDAQAITGGERDDANHYSGVGMIAFYEGGLPYRCSATLVSRTVLLTAAHCTAATAGKTIVTFSPVVAEQPPSGLPVAADADAGYTNADIAEDWYTGTAYAHPEYSAFTDVKNWNDVGVVILDQPVGDVPAKLAPVGTLDAIPQSTLNSTLFRIVGYGTEVRDYAPVPTDANQGKKPTPHSYPIVRRYADAPGQKLTPQILQVNGNINDPRGTGGSCFGDSGGPAFYPGEGKTDEKIVAVTSYGYTDNCRYLDGLQRVDIAVVQNWLKPIVKSGKAPTDYFGHE
ncbi:MAG: trypsin-like serine protease [Propionicimonas sp.]